MKRIRLLMVLGFALVVLVPAALFRWESGIVSEIDNRMLAESPFSPEERAKGGDLTGKITGYVNDRIGLRDEMILAYTVLNDRLFGKMVHPIYTYGKDGYVFPRMGNPVEYGEFQDAFADMVKQMQDYCEARSVPFLFAFEPSKTSVLQEYLPAGVRYDNSWVNQFLAALEERGVRYVDNTGVMRERIEAGEEVFNRQFDAGHWNDVGAFYGVNTILETLREDFPGIHVNTWEEMSVSEEMETALPVSKFPIEEWVPLVSTPAETEDWRAFFDAEVERDAAYPGFNDCVNGARLAEGAPRVLVFQGSYMNGKGYKYFANALGEYISVSNYENVINFDYYFSIFQPECVVFEVTEYAMTPGYFNLERMQAMDLPCTLEAARMEADSVEELVLQPESLSVEQGEALTKVVWNGGGEQVWALLPEGTFSFRQNEEAAFTLTVKNEVWDADADAFGIGTWAGGVLRIYR